MTLQLGPRKRKARVIHRYPNGNDPRKRKLFGDDKKCSKCELIKDIKYFHKQRSARRLRGRKPVTITFKDFMKAWAAQKKKYGLICPISNQQMTHIQGLGNLETNISIDRIDSSKDYIKGNIQFICRRVNTMKHNESLESLIFWSRAITEHYV